MFLFNTDGRKVRNDISNDCAIDNEQKNQETSVANTLSHHSSTPKIDQATSIAGANRAPYRNISYRSENCMCKIFNLHYIIKVQSAVEVCSCFITFFSRVCGYLAGICILFSEIFDIILSK